MDDLISRYDAIKAIQRVPEGNWKNTRYVNVIKAVLPAFPQPKTGHWIDEGWYADGYSGHAYRCSECGGHIIEHEPDDYCKFCGAKMEEQA